MTEVVTTITIAVYWVLIFICVIVVGEIIITRRNSKKKAIPYIFIESYKSYTIFKDLRNGYYFALDKDEKQLSKRLTIEFLEQDIDDSCQSSDEK